MVDLVTMQEWVWEGRRPGRDLGQPSDPRQSQGHADEWRAQMIEAAVEMDDDAMEAYLEGEEPDVDAARLIRKGTLSLSFVPVSCGSAFKNKGVQPLLNAVIDYLPGPLDVSPIWASSPGDETETRDIAPSPMTNSRSPAWPSRS